MKKTVDHKYYHKRDYERALADIAADITKPEGDDNLSHHRRTVVRYMRKKISAQSAKFVELRYGERLTIRKISARLDVSPNTVIREILQTNDIIDEILSFTHELIGNDLFNET